MLVAHLESHFGSTSPVLMSPYTSLADEFSKSKFTFVKAIEFYEKALNVINVTLGSSHPYRKVVESNMIEVVGENARLNYQSNVEL